MSIKKTIKERANIIGVALFFLMIVGALFGLEAYKTSNRLKEIEAQQNRKIAIMQEKEMVENEIDFENYPPEAVEKCKQERGEGSKPWRGRQDGAFFGIFHCGCEKGYASESIEHPDGWKRYCKKLDMSGEEYCVQKYGSRWTMNDLYGSCDCKSGYTQSDDGSFRCFTPSEYCIYLNQTGEECLKIIQQISDDLYEYGKLTPR